MKLAPIYWGRGKRCSGSKTQFREYLGSSEKTLFRTRDARDESDCAARDRPDRTEIRSDDFAAPVATPAVAVAASAVAVATPAVAVAAPAVTAVSTSCATGTLFSALPAHYGERAKHSFCSGDGREARPHNWW